MRIVRQKIRTDSNIIIRENKKTKEKSLALYPNNTLLFLTFAKTEPNNTKNIVIKHSVTIYFKHCEN